MDEPITIPARCQLAWDALNGRIDYALHLRRDGWYSTRDLFAVTGRPSTERKVRELRDLGLIDWRKVPDHITGGEFVEFKVAAEPGRGHEIKCHGQPGLSDSQMGPIAPAQADLFTVVQHRQ